MDETVDEPASSSRLEEPETEDIKTVTTGDTLYSSAKRFEDLPISEPLLQVGTLPASIQQEAEA